MSINLIILVGSFVFLYCFTVLSYLFYHLSNQEEGYHLELSLAGTEFKLSFLSPDYHRPTEPDPWEVKTLKTDNGECDEEPEAFYTANTWTPQLSQAGLALLQEINEEVTATFNDEQVIAAWPV